MKNFSLVLLLLVLLIVTPLAMAPAQMPATANAYKIRNDVKALLLRTIQQQAWRGRYETGRMRMTFPSDFPRTGRAAVRSVLWDESSKRFSARVVITPDLFAKEDSDKPVSARGERLISLSGQAIPYVRVLAVRNTLLYGTRITRADLKVVEVPHSKKLHSALTQWDQALGKEMRVRRSAGSVLRARDLRPARLVRRRSIVQVIYNEGGVRVVLQALALSNGVHGETVRLRNKFSGREFSAIVDGAGHATVPDSSQSHASVPHARMPKEDSVSMPLAEPPALDHSKQSRLAENPFRVKKQRQYDDLLNQPLLMKSQ